VDKKDTLIQSPRPGAPEVLVVEASAGSGKTYELAGRYLRLLFDPSLNTSEIPLKNILAITFTNKACLEMKARILQFLKQLALDGFDDEKDKATLLSKLELPYNHANMRAHLVMEEIISRYNYFQVQTIDSFINAILSGCAFKLELSSDFRIKNDYREYLIYSFDELIEEAAEVPQVKAQFQRFLQSYLHLENRRSWFPKNDILQIMGTLMSTCNIYGLTFIKYGKGFDEINALRGDIRNMMLQMKHNFPDGANGVVWGKFIRDFDESVDASSIDDFFKPFSASRDTFAARKGAYIPEDIVGLWQQIKNAIARLYEWEACSRYDPYIDIFKGVEEKFRRICRQDDVMFLEEMNARAQGLFMFGSITVPELYYRLATQFRHFLIDEFQDTSILQWKNIYPMVEEALATGGSLFYVGDKKQAIFRFRGGEVALMEYLKKQLSAFNVRSQALSRNFRSQKEIVEFNNAVFSPENIGSMLAGAQGRKTALAELSQNEIDEICSIFQIPGRAMKKNSHRDMLRSTPLIYRIMMQRRNTLKKISGGALMSC